MTTNATIICVLFNESDESIGYVTTVEQAEIACKLGKKYEAIDKKIDNIKMNRQNHQMTNEDYEQILNGEPQFVFHSNLDIIPENRREIVLSEARKKFETSKIMKEYKRAINKYNKIKEFKPLTNSETSRIIDTEFGEGSYDWFIENSDIEFPSYYEELKPFNG